MIDKFFFFFFVNLFVSSEKSVPFYSIIPVLLLVFSEIFIRHLTGSTLRYFQYAHEQCALSVHVFRYHKCETENVISRNRIVQNIETVHVTQFFLHLFLHLFLKLLSNWGKILANEKS